MLLPASSCCLARSRSTSGSTTGCLPLPFAVSGGGRDIVGTGLMASKLGRSLAKLRRSRGRPIDVLLLPPPALCSTISEPVPLWRLRLCSGSVSSGYSSLPSVRRGVPSAICGCSTGWLGCGGVRGASLGVAFVGAHSVLVGGLK